MASSSSSTQPSPNTDLGPVKPRHLFLWCVPRSSSTAIAKCLSFIDDDTEVWFEPFDVCRTMRAQWRKQSGTQLPLQYTGNEQQFADMFDRLEMYGMKVKDTEYDIDLLSYEGVKRGLESTTKTTVIVKDMVIASYGAYDYLPLGFTYVLLIRHPHRVFPSFKRMLLDTFKVPEDTDFEVIYDPYNPPLHFYGEMYEMWKHLKANVDPEVIIIDADDLLANPEPYIRKICDAIRVEFREDMLKWDSSREITKSWRGGWIKTYTSDAAANSLTFKRANFSSQFHPPEPMQSKSAMSDDLIRLIDKSIGMYQEMYEHRYVPAQG